jgi:hypothetical protein
MTRLAAAGFAVVALVVPLVTARPQALVLVGLIALLLAAVGIAMLWRWLVTAAACLFLVAYAAALWLAAAAPGPFGPAVFGLSILLMLQCVELARATRGATVDAAAVRSQILTWAGFGAGTLAASMLIVTLGAALVTSIPVAVAPLVAAASALGVLLALAVMATRPRG